MESPLWQGWGLCVAPRAQILSHKADLAAATAKCQACQGQRQTQSALPVGHQPSMWPTEDIKTILMRSVKPPDGADPSLRSDFHISAHEATASPTI